MKQLSKLYTANFLCYTYGPWLWVNPLEAMTDSGLSQSEHLEFMHWTARRLFK